MELYEKRLEKATSSIALPAVPSNFLLRLFPFAVILDRDMCIVAAGEKLANQWGGIKSINGMRFSQVFRLRRPKVLMTWTSVRRSEVFPL